MRAWFKGLTEFDVNSRAIREMRLDGRFIHLTLHQRKNRVSEVSIEYPNEVEAQTDFEYVIRDIRREYPRSNYKKGYYHA